MTRRRHSRPNLLARVLALIDMALFVAGVIWAAEMVIRGLAK